MERQSFSIKCHARTDVGLHRSGNEDAFALSLKHGLYVIADGMGGHNAGEVASKMAVDILESYDREVGLGDLEQVREAIACANLGIYERSVRDAACAGMGTTITMLKQRGGVLMFGHVGDSRLYCLGPERCWQVTSDHSLVWELLRHGLLTKDECRFHPQKNVLMKAMGQGPEVDIDVGIVALHKGQRFVVCSDGLTDMLGDDDILRIAMQYGANPEKATEVYIAEALQNGGLDNVTVLCLAVD